MNPLISVKSKTEQSYDIVFFQNFEALVLQLKDQTCPQNTLIITDKNVYKQSPFFESAKKEGFENILVLPPGEKQKKWDSVDKILEKAFTLGLNRSSHIIAVGGGVVGDMAGFAASIFMRGINCIQVPTSLLAMVDASIGGKTGIDCDYGKNLIGTITPPQHVFVCEAFLQTLPDEELKNGICEMVKHGIVSSEKHFQNLEKLSQQEISVIRKNINTLIIDSIKIKKNIVEEDEKESGVRMHLNLGHTFGHAIEWSSGFEIPHGRAVAMGCVMAGAYAQEKGLCSPETVDRIENIFHQFGIDCTCDIPDSQIWKAMAHDKKKKGDIITLILPKKIGLVERFEIKE